MQTPTLFLVVLLSFPSSSRAAVPGSPGVAKAPTPAEDSPIKLGPATPEGFNDPAHVHFFRYLAYLSKNHLESFGADAWKALTPDQRNEKIQNKEKWLKDKLSALMNAPFLSDEDRSLLAAVWGPDVAKAAKEVSQALKLGDPEAIRAAREKVQGLVKAVGGASLDWPAIFDGAAPGTPGVPALPDPLALKKQDAFLASLQSPAVRAPLADKATFVAFLRQKEVPADALPALTAMYEVLSSAKEPEKSQVAHLLPTVVKFLNDGKRIANAEMPGALAFAAADDYSNPSYVGITAASRTSDPVEIASILSHEFEHVYDQYTGRYYTLDSELRGFKTNVLFFDIMKKDPVYSKKLNELLNSNDDATRAFFQDHAQVDATYAQDPQTFAAMVAYGHGYSSQYQGLATGIGGWSRLSLREATDPNTGLQRQLSWHKAQLAIEQKQAAALQATLSTLSDPSASSTSQRNDQDIQKTAKDLAAAQGFCAQLSGQIAIEKVALDRMLRERSWLDKTAANAGQTPPAYDLNLPVSADYMPSGN
jgi:hypothetical protein